MRTKRPASQCSNLLYNLSISQRLAQADFNASRQLCVAHGPCHTGGHRTSRTLYNPPPAWSSAARQGTAAPKRNETTRPPEDGEVPQCQYQRTHESSKSPEVPMALSADAQRARCLLGARLVPHRTRRVSLGPPMSQVHQGRAQPPVQDARNPLFVGASAPLLGVF